MVVLFPSHSIRCGYLEASWPHFAACIRTSCWFHCKSGASRCVLDLGSVVNSVADRSFVRTMDTPNHLRHDGTDRGGSEDCITCSLDCVNSPEYSLRRSGRSLDVLGAVR